MKKVIPWFLDKFHYYVVFSKAILFISGLIFSYSFVWSSFSCVLILRLSNIWEDNLPTVAQVTNLHEGSSEVLQIFFAYVADAYSGLFPMLLVSTTIYIIGLCLCFVTSLRGVFYIALVLITLSQAAKEVTLKAFLDDQLLAMERVPGNTEDEEKANWRSKFWWILLALLAAIASLLLSLLIEFNVRHLSMILAIALGVGFIWFLLGTNFYTHNEPKRSPLTDVVFLLKMLPLWTAFLTFGLVAATGSTFFLEEAGYINDGFPPLVFVILESFMQFIVAEISDYITDKLNKKYNTSRQKVMLWRIGMGMVSCGLCCMSAFINAHHYTTIFRLVPQYLFLGIMKGLSEDGLENFFDSQVSESKMSRYGPQFGGCVMGVGKVLSILCILFFSRTIPWIKHDINSSRLDKYYAVLTVFSLVNMIIFWILAYWYGDEISSSEDPTDLENGFEAPVEGKLENGVEQSQAQEDGVPLLNLKTGQETNVSSSSVLPEDEALRVNPDVPMLNETRSFSRPSSKGIQKRFHSMH